MRNPLPPPPDKDGGPEGRGPKQSPQKKPRPRIPIWYFIVPVVLLVLIFMEMGNREELDYGDFKRKLKQGQITEVTLQAGEVKGKMMRGDEEVEFVSTLPPGVVPDDSLVPLLQEQVGPNWRAEESFLDSPLLYLLLPLVFIFFLWRFMMSRMSPGGGGVMEFGQSRARMVAQTDVEISFDDVAGIPECKQELQEIVEFLRTPEKFTRLGGRIPKGVLLVGPPGTGKTLLAKAVAGEAEVTFFSLSGSDFVEMFVGVGAARVRDLFQQAQKNAPCIVFIDELDALGKTRGSGMMGGHDEREQTLNALLVQMDGFTAQKGIILLAATNRPEMLDPALLRPGRFDRQVVVPPPDLRDREQILDVHTREVKLGPEVDLHKLAGMTPGFVGADLANLVNEATLMAARRDKNQVEMEEFEDSLERVVAGLEKRNRLMNDQEKDIVAHHEAGHALVASMLPGTDPVHKVSMIPRGMAALGYTLQRPTEDRYLLRYSELVNRMAVMLGGRTAEELVFDEVSTGAQNDLERATEVAREMVVDFGMSEEIGPLSYSTDSKRRQGAEALWGRPYSERTARKIDEAIRALVDSAHDAAREMLSDKKDALLALAEMLKEKEVVEQEELRDLLADHGIDITEQHLDDEQELDGEEVEASEQDGLRPEAPSGGDDREGRSG